jgi:adapter protein MecA 1/2
MMQQANLEYGFDAEDTPLMIEAIPINSECIVLIITKVEDPEELDTRFSNFAPSVHEEDEEDDDYGDYEDDEYDEDEDEDVSSLFKRLQHSNMADFIDTSVSSSPSSDPKKLKEKTSGARRKGQPSRKGSRIFSFDSLHEVMKFAAIVTRKFNGKNTLYKNEANGKFYLILHQGDIEDGIFANICSLLTEYGKTEIGSTAKQQFLDEHYTIVIADNAIQTLSKI